MYCAAREPKRDRHLSILTSRCHLKLLSSLISSPYSTSHLTIHNLQHNLPHIHYTHNTITSHSPLYSFFFSTANSSYHLYIPLGTSFLTSQHFAYRHALVYSSSQFPPFLCYVLLFVTLTLLSSRQAPAFVLPSFFSPILQNVSIFSFFLFYPITSLFSLCVFVRSVSVHLPPTTSTWTAKEEQHMFGGIDGDICVTRRHLTRFRLAVWLYLFLCLWHH